MGTKNEQTALRPPAHPMTGWLVVVPLPDPDTLGDEQDDASSESITVRVGDNDVHLSMLDLGRFLSPQPGIGAGLVAEVGPLPSGVDLGDHEVVAPYEEGCTVYYSLDRGVRIGGYLYLNLSSVLAWEESPRWDR